MLGCDKELSNQTNMGDIYIKHMQLMYSVAKKFTSNIEDQKDIVQTALERLLKIFSVPGAKKRCISSGYIVFTVRSVAIDFLRKEGRESEHCVSIDDSQLTNIANPNNELEDLYRSSDGAERLRSVWPNLSAEDRIVLEGKYILDLTDEELAGIFNCNPNSIRMKLTRARRRAIKLLLERNEL